MENYYLSYQLCFLPYAMSSMCWWHALEVIKCVSLNCMFSVYSFVAGICCTGGKSVACWQTRYLGKSFLFLPCVSLQETFAYEIRNRFQSCAFKAKPRNRYNKLMTHSCQCDFKSVSFFFRTFFYIHSWMAKITWVFHRSRPLKYQPYCWCCRTMEQ